MGIESVYQKSNEYGKVRMSFSEETIQSVWEKGEIVAKYDANRFRKDQYGAWIRRLDYGGENFVLSNGVINKSKQAGRLKCVVVCRQIIWTHALIF